MITNEEALSLQEERYVDKIAYHKDFLSDRENYLSSLRKNANKEKRLDAEGGVKRAKEFLNRAIDKFEQFKKYKLYCEELWEIKRQIAECAKKREEIYSSIGNSAMLIDMEFDKTKRDGVC